MKIHDIEPGFITFGGARSPWGDKSRGFRRTPTHSNASEYSDPSCVCEPDGHNVPKTSGVFVPDDPPARKTSERTSCCPTPPFASLMVPPLMMPRVAQFSKQVVDPDLTKTPESFTESSISNDKTIKAPIPGVVVEIKVSEGEKVTKGMTVAVIEAMKMENDILAESDGTVAAIKVTTGAAVLEGDTILTIE